MYFYLRKNKTLFFGQPLLILVPGNDWTATLTCYSFSVTAQEVEPMSTPRQRFHRGRRATDTKSRTLSTPTATLVSILTEILGKPREITQTQVYVKRKNVTFLFLPQVFFLFNVSEWI